ncbi:MAG: FKBP-type peptidyl-prolyl cis-trans isomerase N-terminal domain-containing protein, partial [Paludibacteraceae bacterium]|nr:FKBP-type peptidyl-prolyl cis-trans isomerase N-terminal domain-containing protein [Paludibacteraceae bacterium]
MEKVSYALGLSIGNNLLSSGIKDVNLEKFSKGVSDVLKGANPEMTYDEAKKILDKFFKELSEKINGKNAAVGKAFIEKNK